MQQLPPYIAGVNYLFELNTSGEKYLEMLKGIPTSWNV